MATIRLNLNRELERMLRELREQRFSLLENAEIIRVILSEYFAEWHKKQKQWNEKEFLHKLDALPELPLSDEERAELRAAIDEAGKEPGEIMTIDEMWEKVKNMNDEE